MTFPQARQKLRSNIRHSGRGSGGGDSSIDKKRTEATPVMNMLETSKFREIVKNVPLVAIDLIVRNRESDVLIGLRKSGPAKNYWFVPGGRIWKDERIQAAFRRITRGELGISLDLKNARFLKVSEHLYRQNFADEPGFGTHYIVLAYETTLPRDDAKLPLRQHSEYRWLSEKQLLQDRDVHPYTKDYSASVGVLLKRLNQRRA